jgi:hypothetical protein
MKMSDDLENELQKLALVHLTESEMIAYCEQALDYLTKARAAAHLKQCFICETQLALFQEASAPSSEHEITAEDIALVRRVMKQQAAAPDSPDMPPQASLRERLAEYWEQLVDSWKRQFEHAPAHRGVETGVEIWRKQSKDGRLQARAVLETTADLTLHFSSNDMAMEGVHLKVRLGPLSHEATMQRVSDSEVYAKITVPRRQRPRRMADISIESS